MVVSEEETEADMALHIDIDDHRFREAAEQILLRHDNFQPEANITSSVRDFLILTGLARSEEIVEENPPSDASRCAVDLTALDTFIEFKRRVGTTSSGEPDPETCGNWTTTWPNRQRREGSAWASSPTAGGGCCAGPGRGRSV